MSFYNYFLNKFLSKIHKVNTKNNLQCVNKIVGNYCQNIQNESNDNGCKYDQRTQIQNNNHDNYTAYYSSNNKNFKQKFMGQSACNFYNQVAQNLDNQNDNDAKNSLKQFANDGVVYNEKSRANDFPLISLSGYNAESSSKSNIFRTALVVLFAFSFCQNAHCGVILDFFKKFVNSEKNGDKKFKDSKKGKGKKVQNAQLKNEGDENLSVEKIKNSFSTNDGYSKDQFTLETLFYPNDVIAQKIKKICSGKVLIVFCTANFCGYCKPVKEMLHALPSKFQSDDYKILLLNCDENIVNLGSGGKVHADNIKTISAMKNCINYYHADELQSINGIPFMAIYNDGKFVCSFNGAAIVKNSALFTNLIRALCSENAKQKRDNTMVDARGIGEGKSGREVNKDGGKIDGVVGKK